MSPAHPVIVSLVNIPYTLRLQWSSTCAVCKGGFTVEAENHYCANRVCSSGACSASVNKGSVAECALAVATNNVCGKHFSYDTDGWCDCVAPGDICNAQSQPGNNTYSLLSVGDDILNRISRFATCLPVLTSFTSLSS